MTGVSDIPGRIGRIQPHRPDKKGDELSVENELFKKRFEKAMADAAEKTEQSASASSLSEVSAPSFRPLTTLENRLLEETDILLSKLETYGRSIGNPEISLREIEPAITEIRDAAKELSNNAANSNEGAEIKAIAEESALAASIEYIRFMRGDYI